MFLTIEELIFKPVFLGWQGNGYICEDINECEISNGGCSVVPPVECINTPGSYHCRPCPPGATPNFLIPLQAKHAFENRLLCSVVNMTYV